jgi:tRNA-dihydrouridine synthase A
VPPLDWALVDRLKADYPTRPIAVNGGIESIEQAADRLRHVDGVMIGRAAYRTPELLLRVDPVLFGESAPAADACEALDAYEAYIGRRLADGVRLHDMSKCLLGLFGGMAGARAWRRCLATEGQRPGADLTVLRRARDCLRPARETESA